MTAFCIVINQRIYNHANALWKTDGEGASEVVRFTFDLHRILMNFQEQFEAGAFLGGHFEELLRIVRRVDWSADRFTLELNVTLVTEIKRVPRKHPSVQIALHLVVDTLFFDGSHDARSKIDHVSQDWELLSRAWCANYTRKTLARGHPNVAVGAADFIQGSDHIETRQKGALCVVAMCDRLQAKDADHRATFVVHHKLVDGAFQAIDLLLNCRYDILNLRHAFCRSCRRQINPQADKHNRQRSNLGGKRSLLDSQVRNHTLWNALLEHGLDSAEDLSFELRAYFHAGRRDLDPVRIIDASQIN